MLEAEGVAVDKDVMVTMRDGVRIALDVYRPKELGRYPVLYAVSPYQKDSVNLPSVPIFRARETGDIPSWVCRGYAYVHADARGSGKSEGIWRMRDKIEQLDMYDTIEWAAAQPWSNGKVGMIGESYYGWVQWFAAQLKPPHLACIAPYDAAADDYRDWHYHGGIFSEAFVTYLYHLVRNWGYLDQPGQRPPDFMSYDYLRDVVMHPNFDEFWQERRARFEEITIPVLSIGNWWSLGLHSRGNLIGYEQVRGPKKLIMACGDQQQVFLEEPLVGALERWYDHWLKGIENGVMEEAPVSIYVRNGQGYREEREWPLARAEVQKLYLHPGPSGAVESLNDGVLSWDPPRQDVPPTSYDYPQPGWSLVPGTYGSAVQGAAGLPHVTRKILTFTSPPLKRELEITGPIALYLWASSNQRDTDFMIRIEDQLPPVSDVSWRLLYTSEYNPRIFGEELPPGIDAAALAKRLDVAPPAEVVTRGWLKASHRALNRKRSTPLQPYHTHQNPQPLEPGKVYEFAIEVWPTSYVFRAGHRIRLELSSCDSQVYDAPFPHHYGFKMGRDTLYHDAVRPSHLLLPVIPG